MHHFLRHSGLLFNLFFLFSHHITVLCRKFTYDSLKIEHQAGGAKTSDPVISKERDETLVLIKPADTGTVLKTIGELGVRDETEVSLFSWRDYVEYCEGDAHGQTQW